MKNETRRRFIQTVALGAAAVTSGISHASATNLKTKLNKNNPPLKLGLMTYNLGKDWDIETIIKNCSETGMVHAELRTTHKHGVELTLNKRERTEVKKRFEDSPMEAISLASAYSYHYTDPNELKENIEGTKKYLQLAADVGAIGIRVFPNDFPKGVSREKTMEQIGKALNELGEFGYNVGVDVRISVHEHSRNTTGNVPVIRKILDYSNSKHVYVNWNCMGSDTAGGGIEENFNMVKDRIRGVHLHDLHSEYPYRTFLKLLRDSGYKGYCNTEIEQSCEPIKLMNYYRTLFLALQDEF